MNDVFIILEKAIERDLRNMYKVVLYLLLIIVVIKFYDNVLRSLDIIKYDFFRYLKRGIELL